jgi:hypothetical protein
LEIQVSDKPIVDDAELKRLLHKIELCLIAKYAGDPKENALAELREWCNKSLPHQVVGDEGELKQAIHDIFHCCRTRALRGAEVRLDHITQAEHAVLAVIAASNKQSTVWLEGLHCPACNSKNTLFVAAGNYVTCSLDKCPNPDYADALAASNRRAALEARVDEVQRLSKTRWVDLAYDIAQYLRVRADNLQAELSALTNVKESEKS